MREHLWRGARWLRAPRNAAVAVALLMVVGLALHHCWSFVPNTIDDAFITFRYADNLAHGRGLVFNPGERVEGSSTFLETIALAVASLFGADLLVASRIIGVTSLVALIVGVFVVVTELVPTCGRVLGLAAAAIVGASMSLALYAMSGLETNLFAALLFLGVALHLHAARANARGAAGTKAWALTLGAVALTRPEGIGYFALLAGLSLVHDLFSRMPVREAATRAGRSTIWFLAVYSPLLAFRLLYFRALVPNTVTAKSHMSTVFHGKRLAEIAHMLATGAGAHHLDEYTGMLGVAAYLLPAGLLRRGTRYPTLVLLAVCSASLLVDALDDGDWMPGWRLLTPAVAPMAVLLALGLAAVLFRPDQRLLRTQLPSLAITLLVMAPAAMHLYPGGWTPSTMDEYRFWLAKKLALATRSDDLLATDMAGVIPYYSHMRTIDMNGLCDREIALHGEPYGAMGKIDRPYVISRKPTFFQTNFVSELRAIVEDPRFKPMLQDYYAVITDGYRKGASIRDRKLLIVRKDRPELSKLTEALGGAQLVDLAQQLKNEH